MTTAPAGIDTLMAFRLAYLRTIAAYWRDPIDFARDLPEADAAGNFGHHRLLEARCPAYQWSWDMDLQLVLDDVIRWGEGGNAGWSGPPNEVTIFLPDPPARERDYAAGLTAYYAEFPSFIGGGLREGAEDGGGIGGPLPLGLGGLQSFHEFGAVVVRALAMCWAEQGPNPNIDGPIRAALLADGNAGLVRYLGYCLPWNLEIMFRRGTGTYKPPLEEEDEGGPGPGGWKNLPKNRLSLHLPQPPGLPQRSFPVALAAYNNTGDAYPFSCGC